MAEEKYKSVKITTEAYDMLDILRKTEKGKVTFSDIIVFLVKNREVNKNEKEESKNNSQD